MLPKTNRLKKKKDFDRVARSKRRAVGQFLVVKACSNKQPATRVGFVVSKKVSKKAVLRNKTKRRLREAVTALLPQIRHGYDLVFFSRPQIIEKDLPAIKDEAEQLLKRLKLLNA